MTTQLIALLADRHALLVEIRRRAAKYSEDQPRDEAGRWTDGGGGSYSASSAKENISSMPQLSVPAGDALINYTTKDYRSNGIRLEGERLGDLGGFTSMRPILEEAAGINDHTYGDNLSRAEFMEVSISKLSTYQAFVDADKMKRYADEMASITKNHVGVVLDYGGKLWLMDGNHRVNTLLAGGAKTVNVLIFKGRQK